MARIENWNPPKLDYTIARYTWDVDYATDVHEGFIRDGIIFPARPWTDDALGRVDVEEEFRQAWIDSEDLNESFRDFAQVIFNEFRVSMADPIWNWPRDTQRKSGEYVEAGNRNIIDTQELYNSQKLEFE